MPAPAPRPGPRTVQFAALIDTLRLQFSCFGVAGMAMTVSENMPRDGNRALVAAMNGLKTDADAYPEAYCTGASFARGSFGPQMIFPRVHHWEQVFHLADPSRLGT